MAISLEDIKQLCMEGESNHLDYKLEQYPFVGVSAPEKAELLKDVLALANAFRKGTAYILIGVAQQPDGSGLIVGLPKENFIDDAKLQQFINEKTNRVVEFSSYAVEIDCANIIQVIEIQLQRERPYYPQRALGGINAGTVFIRIGSSTRIATPDEIALMGKEEQLKHNQHDIDISLIVPGNEIENINFSALEISLSDQPPIDSNPGRFDITVLSRPITFTKKFTYVHDVFRTVRVNIGLENKSNLSAEQIEIESFISQCSNECVREKEDFPSRPSEYPGFDCRPFLKAPSLQSLKLHPGKYNPSSESLYFEVMHDGDFTLDITVLGKDMQPITKQFHINVQLIPFPISSKEVEMFFCCFEDEDQYWNFRDEMHKGRDNANT